MPEQVQDPGQARGTRDGFSWGKVAWIALICFIGFVCVPISWLAFARVVGSPPIQSGEAGGALIATIGGIMGAIFTIGGLVVALVAILAQLTVRDRVSRALEEASARLEAKYESTRTEMERRYDEDLQPRLIQLAKDRVQAALIFFQASATDASEWRRAISLTEEALAKDPELQGAKRWLAARLADVVVTQFWRRHTPESGAPQLLDWRIAITPMATSSPELPTDEARTWITSVMQAAEANDALISELPLMWAIDDRYDRMMEAIETVKAAYPDVPLFLRQPREVCILSYACGNDSARLSALGQAISMTMPADKAGVLASVNGINPRDIYEPYVTWYVLPKPSSGAPALRPFFPGRLRIYGPERTSGESRSYASYSGDETSSPPGVETIPRSNPDNTARLEPLAELLEQLMHRFLFLSRV